jgi:hypothetical protein
VIERLESAGRSARHAVELMVEDVATVAPGWLVGGVLLHVLQQVVRTRARLEVLAGDDTQISQVAVRSAPRLPHMTD